MNECWLRPTCMAVILGSKQADCDFFVPSKSEGDASLICELYYQQMELCCSTEAINDARDLEFQRKTTREALENK